MERENIQPNSRDDSSAKAVPLGAEHSADEPSVSETSQAGNPEVRPPRGRLVEAAVIIAQAFMYIDSKGRRTNIGSLPRGSSKPK
jgi:hypothetical protein